jgi:hypothetical protein
MKNVLAIAAMLAFAALAAATEYHVTPTGTAGGSGSSGSPWDLTTALAKTTVHGGDTIWVHGGSYPGGYTSSLTGATGNNILVRNYNNERASVEAAFTVNGANVTFWGLEILCSGPTRVSTSSAPTLDYGIAVYAVGVKCINCIVHDTAEGFSAYNAAASGEYYGNLSYYNGYIGTDRAHGHGFYLQNISGIKYVEENFCGDNACEGMQIYGSGNASLIGFRVDGNVLYNTAWVKAGGNHQYNFIVGGGNQRRDVKLNNNYSYFTANEGGTIDVSAYNVGQDLEVKDNVFVGGYGSFNIGLLTGPTTVTGNRIVHRPGEDLTMVWFDISAGGAASTYTWDNNQYFGSGYVGGCFRINSSGGGSYFSYDGWKSQTGFDANSVYSATMPTGKWVYVRPNKYEAGRANITIYNFDKSGTVDVDLSPALTPGSTYVIRDAQNIFATTPVKTGTYAGGTVPITMTGLTKPQLAGLGYATPNHTAPEFGTFVLFKTGGGSIGVYGDANNDGAFGMADINQMVDWLLSRTPPPASGTARFIVSDVNGDSQLTMADLNLYVDRLLGRITKFPVEP